MTPRFPRGSIAYAKNGRSYVVEEVVDGMVYCSSTNGAEAEFPVAALMTEAEWTARTDTRRDQIYAKLKQSRTYTKPPGVTDKIAAAEVLAKVERLSPGLLDFAAYTAATRALAESGDQDLAAGLAIKRCREVFEAAAVDIRAGLLATLLGVPADRLVGAGRLGDNLMRAMLEKGLATRADEYETFRDRRRN